MPIWIKEISCKKVIITGLIIAVITFIIRQIEVVFTMKYYLMSEYYGLWSKLMMPKAGPPPFEFMLTSVVSNLVTGFSLAIIYYYLRSHLPKDHKKRIFYFADLMIGTSFIFFTIPSFLLFNIPLGLLSTWFVSSFIILVADSFVIVKIIK